MANSRLPVRVPLYGGAYQFVPSRTTILNPELKGEATQLYLIWGTEGEGSNKGVLSNITNDENTPLFAWLSDDERFITNAYQSSFEFSDCVKAVLETNLLAGYSSIELAISKPQVASEGPGMVARFQIRHQNK